MNEVTGAVIPDIDITVRSNRGTITSVTNPSGVAEIFNVLSISTVGDTITVTVNTAVRNRFFGHRVLMTFFSRIELQ